MKIPGDKILMNLTVSGSFPSVVLNQKFFYHLMVYSTGSRLLQFWNMRPMNRISQHLSPVHHAGKGWKGQMQLK